MMPKVSTQSSFTDTADGVSRSRQINNDITTVGTNRTEKTATITTSETTLALDLVATLGILTIRNNEVAPSTNFVRWGTVTGQYGNRVLPGEEFVYRPNGNTIFIQAVGGSAKISFTAIEA